MTDLTQLDSYDFELPPELIAREPLPERDASRLLHVHRESETVAHRQFRDIVDLLNPNDCLVVNQTRVLPARLLGTRTETGGKWEGLYLEADPDGNWILLSQTRGKLQASETITLSPIHTAAENAEQQSSQQLQLRLLKKLTEGRWLAQPLSEEPVEELLAIFGTMPLPPYIGRKVANQNDLNRYQTTYAAVPGAVAAPTAGLHFTSELLDQCRDKGITIATVTLHVGIGTFRPISVNNLAEHHMHAEWCEINEETVNTIQAVRSNGGRVIAVGTTSVRTLESAARTGTLEPFCGETDLFIRPPYEFRAVDGLITNFHLPKSSLLVMISAFAGFDLVRHAYREAVENRYRFFSYGDAMFIE